METTVPIETETAPEEEPPESILDEAVEKIEFYLDGPKESGIFLGETIPDREREDVKNTYGESFLNTGFDFTLELKNHNLKQGIHALFIYASTDKGTVKYILKKLIVQGEEEDSNIMVTIEDPENYSAISSEEIKILGWAIDTDSSENTGIDKVELYLDGTMENGIFLGDANYGTITRYDIASTFGSPFANSGFYMNWKTSNYSIDSDHFIFAYAHSIQGEWNYAVSEIYFEDEESSNKNLIIEIDNDLSDFEIEPDASFEISGWAIFSEADIDTQVASKEPGSPGSYQNKKVVFASDMDGEDYDLFIINLEGTQLFQLTDSDVDELYPAVSPDGSKIAFTSTVDGFQQIMVINIDGTDLSQVTSSDTHKTYPSWSFDGRYIFFDSKAGNYYGIYRVNADGSDLKRLNFNPDYDIQRPACVFNKPLVLFETAGEGTQNILIMDFEGEEVQSVILDEERNIAPDASNITGILAFASYRSGNSEIYISTMTGDNITQVTSLGGNNNNPALSPDGKYIGFDSDIKGNRQIYLFSFENEELIDLMDDDVNNYMDPCFLFY